MKRKGTKNLTRTQRLMLEDCVNAGLSKKLIAEKLGVCLSTVYKEIKRGAYYKKVRSWTGYYAKFITKRCFRTARRSRRTNTIWR